MGVAFVGQRLVPRVLEVRRFLDGVVDGYQVLLQRGGSEQLFRAGDDRHEAFADLELCISGTGAQKGRELLRDVVSAGEMCAANSR